MTNGAFRKSLPVYFVGAGPGNPDLITLRGQALLRTADVIFHDTGLSSAFFQGCSEGCRVIDVGQVGIAPGEAIRNTAHQIIDAARQGQRVVRLKVGDPLFFSRALDELEALRAAGIPVEVVPGVASPIGAAAFTGVPLTDVRGSQKLVFVAATDLLGNPVDGAEFAVLAKAADTLCVMLIGDQLHSIVNSLLKLERYREARALLVRRATLPEQEVIEAPLAELGERCASKSSNEAGLLILGDVLRHRKQLNWFESQPLFGKRLLLCRPSGQAADSANAILHRGASSEVLPLIEIGPVGDDHALIECVDRVHCADWVIFTSANGVEQFRRVVIASGKDARVFGCARLAVIGPGTAKPLAAWGLKPDLIAKEHVAEALARQILDAGRVQSVMLIRALEARDALPDTLRAAGVAVEIVPAYRTRKLGDAQREKLKHLLHARAIDAVLLTSSSMADSLILALGVDAKDALARVCVASIGPITTATLEKHGIMPTVTATTFTVDGLLDALEGYFTPKSSGD